MSIAPFPQPTVRPGRSSIPRVKTFNEEPSSMSTNLIIPVGIPGCGKSTWAKTLFDLKYTVVSSDGIREKVFGSLKAAHDPEIKAEANARIFDEFHNTIVRNLDHGVDTIADATNLTSSARARLRQIAEEHGAACHLVLFMNVAQAIARNAEREDDKRVPDEVMVFMVKKYTQMMLDLPNEGYASVTRISGVS